VSDSPSSKEKVAPLVERLNLACVASCDCLVKTPVIHYHEPTCKYRVMQEAANALAALDECYDEFGIGAKVRTPSTLLANIQNAFRRSNCLSAIEREFFTKIVKDEDGEDMDECSLNWGSEPEKYVEQFRAALAAYSSAEPRTVLTDELRERARLCGCGICDACAVADAVATLRKVQELLGNLDLNAFYLSLPTDVAYAIARLTEPASPQPPPVEYTQAAWVPVHPREGLLWASAVVSVDADHPASYPLVPVYVCSSPTKGSDHG
jgi:hypothetical protein